MITSDVFHLNSVEFAIFFKSMEIYCTLQYFDVIIL